jgi:hypothetical protein
VTTTTTTMADEAPLIDVASWRAGAKFIVRSIGKVESSADLYETLASSVTASIKERDRLMALQQTSLNEYAKFASYVKEELKFWLEPEPEFASLGDILAALKAYKKAKE